MNLRLRDRNVEPPVERPPGGPAGFAPNRARRRRRRIRLAALVGVIAIGNGPIMASYASDKYGEWQSHQLSYEKRYGRWDVVANTGTRSMHAALLHDGEVLLMGGSGNDQTRFNNKDFRAALWNPVTNSFKAIVTPWDVFCAGHTLLPTGDLLIAGGTKKYEILAQDSPDHKKHEFEGLRDSFVFDEAQQKFVRVGYLNNARWYPTLVELGTGAVLATSGLNQNGDIDPGNTETFDLATKKWVTHPNLQRQFPTYPSLFQMADGRLFFSGANAGYGPATLSQRRPGLWNVVSNSFQPVNGLPAAADNETAATVLLPPAQYQRVMFLGGGPAGDVPTATARTAIVDLRQKDPTWTAGPNLSTPKRYPGAVVLPDDTVLVSGGSKSYRAKDTKTAEIYDVAANSFTKAASPHVGRDYHSMYILLPDGRVAVFGSNPLSDSNFFDGRVEVYSPPYLFEGPRPVINSAPSEVKLGTDIGLNVTGKITKVRLLRPGSYTHVTDTDMRSVALPILGRSGNQLKVRVPTNHNLVPPGYYMVFADNAAGVPSVAKWVDVQ